MDWPKKCEGYTEDGTYFSCDNGKIFAGINENGIAKERTCPVCHGTGEGELTADQAAELLLEYTLANVLIKPEIEFPEYFGDTWKIIIPFLKGRTVRFKKFTGEDLTEVLQKAARAVRSKG